MNFYSYVVQETSKEMNYNIIWNKNQEKNQLNYYKNKTENIRKMWMKRISLYKIEIMIPNNRNKRKIIFCIHHPKALIYSKV